MRGYGVEMALNGGYSASKWCSITDPGVIHRSAEDKTAPSDPIPFPEGLVHDLEAVYIVKIQNFSHIGTKNMSIT